MRGGAYSAVGEGAIAFDGSQLRSAGGLTTLKGSAVYSGGSWLALEDSHFTFNDPGAVISNLQNAYKDIGLSVDASEFDGFSFDNLTSISTDVFSKGDSL